MALLKIINTKWNQYIHTILWGVGIGLIILTLGLLSLSFQFGSDRDLIDKPIVTLVGIMLLAGLIYTLIALNVDQLNLTKKHWIWIIGVGLIMRLMMLPSATTLEDDYHRYLWDGAVTVQGLNPFAYQPAIAMDKNKAQENNYPSKLIDLAQAGHATLKKINHPTIRTIYPPTAQAFFALAYMMKPWSLMAWRLVILFSDIIILILLILLCNQLSLPRARLLIYWWNPLIIKEFYNNAHMDLLIFPFILGALLAVIHHRALLTSFLFGLGVGTKVWPVILLPIYMKSFAYKRWLVTSAILLFGAITALMFWPILQSTLDSSSGFTAYAKRWEMNDALFMMVAWCFKQVAMFFGQDKAAALLWTRLFMMSILGLIILRQIRKKMDQPQELAVSSLWIVATLFLISPTQFPWYYGWVVPFLVFYRSPGLILMSVMLSLYYLRFYFKARNQVNVFDFGIVWLEYIPVWLILIREAVLVRRKQ